MWIRLFLLLELNVRTLIEYIYSFRYLILARCTGILEVLDDIGWFFGDDFGIVGREIFSFNDESESRFILFFASCLSFLLYADYFVVVWGHFFRHGDDECGLRWVQHFLFSSAIVFVFLEFLLSLSTFLLHASTRLLSVDVVGVREFSIVLLVFITFAFFLTFFFFLLVADLIFFVVQPFF
jgi:hypothetical protein